MFLLKLFGFNIGLTLGSIYLGEILIPSESHFTLHSPDIRLLNAPYVRLTNFIKFALGDVTISVS